MTPKQLADIHKAVDYADNGDPIKDAFEHGHDEQDAVLAAFRYVVDAHTKTPPDTETPPGWRTPRAGRHCDCKTYCGVPGCAGPG